MENKPTHYVYHIAERDQQGSDEKRAFWTKIGAAWPHSDGKGFALETVYGRLVLREPRDVEQEQAPAEATEEKEPAPVTAE